MNSKSNSLTWSRLAGVAGVLSVLCYFAAVFLPGPDSIVRLLAFSFGPLLCVSFVGAYRFMAFQKDGPVLQVACLFGIIAGVMVTTMLVVQIGNNMVHADALASAATETARESALLAWQAVNRVQYLLDVVLDIFICISLILLGTVMLGHRAFGRIWGGLGILGGFGLLVLNLVAFPFVPRESGLVDLGPVVMLWMLAVFVRFLLVEKQC